jgi:DNA-binding response OmpR family regulator
MDFARLLIVDDDVKFTRLLSSYLQRFGYTVDAAATGEEGIALAARARYDAVILDVMLPGMNGWEVLRELRRDYKAPILMLTALGDTIEQTAGWEMGATDCLPKTLAMPELLEHLRKTIGESGRNPGAASRLEDAKPGELDCDPPVT